MRFDQNFGNCPPNNLIFVLIQLDFTPRPQSRPSHGRWKILARKKQRLCQVAPKIRVKMGAKILNNDLLYKFWKRFTKLYLYFYIDNIFMKLTFKAVRYKYFRTEKLYILVIGLRYSHLWRAAQELCVCIFVHCNFFLQCSWCFLDCWSPRSLKRSQWIKKSHCVGGI